MFTALLPSHSRQSQAVMSSVAAVFFFIGSFFLSVASAQSNAKNNDQAAVKIGSLMLSPNQRQNLEFLRNSGGDAARTGPAGDELLDPRTGIPVTVQVSGVVIRSDNRSTVWINNQPLYAQGRPTALRDLAAQTGVVGGSKSNMQVQSKPGSIIDVSTRQTTDLLPLGAIEIIPPKASNSAGDTQK